MFRVWILLTLVGCAKRGAQAEEQYRTQVKDAARLSEKPAAEGLVEQDIDINGDGRTDVYNFFRERSADSPRLIVRKETDLNMDGRIDVRSWFDETGKLDKEEIDGDFDSRVDRVDHYQTSSQGNNQNSKLVMSEIDTDYNGIFDLFKFYESGKIRRKERDTNGDGKIDFWEYLDDSGVVVKTGKDVDGDGIMDIRDQ